MSPVVVDASLALAWCFSDETSDYADKVLVALEHKRILVPAVRSLEIANAVLVGERAERIKAAGCASVSRVDNNLEIAQDVQSADACIKNILPVARAHRLSAFDASYLELAARHGIPLATLDKKLQQAARKHSVKLFE